MDKADVVASPLELREPTPASAEQVLAEFKALLDIQREEWEHERRWLIARLNRLDDNLGRERTIPSREERRVEKQWTPPHVAGIVYKGAGKAGGT